MGLSVVDTSVLVAFLETTDSHHAAAVRELTRARASHSLLIPAVVYAEVLVGPCRLGSKAESVADRFLSRIGGVETVSVAIARRAAKIRAASGLKLPDALVIATGLELDADEVLTADRRWQSIDRRVRLI
jgi:predicted nucleic acid-binding protein